MKKIYTGVVISFLSLKAVAFMPVIDLHQCKDGCVMAASEQITIIKQNDNKQLSKIPNIYTSFLTQYNEKTPPAQRRQHDNQEETTEETAKILAIHTASQNLMAKNKCDKLLLRENNSCVIHYNNKDYTIKFNDSVTGNSAILIWSLYIYASLLQDNPNINGEDMKFLNNIKKYYIAGTGAVDVEQNIVGIRSTDKKLDAAYQNRIYRKYFHSSPKIDFFFTPKENCAEAEYIEQKINPRLELELELVCAKHFLEVINKIKQGKN